jgi:hypothetical protein
VDDLIKILTAVAWPIAITFIAIAAIVIVFRVTAKKGEVSVKWKDWGFGAKAAPEMAPPNPESPLAVAQEGKPDVLDHIADDRGAGEESEPVLTFWSAKTETDLDSGFERFKAESDAYSKDPEFWETLKVSRRREIGVGDELTELNALAERNPTWVWPIVFKARRHIRLHELQEAEQALSAATARSDSANKKWVLREWVNLQFQRWGTEGALSLIRAKIDEKCSAIEIASMLRALADLTKVDDEDVFSYAILSEISLALDDSDKTVRFNLGFNYGKIPAYRLTAFERYAPLEHDAEWPSASNNMGVIAFAASKAAQNGLFEKAFELKSDVAAANLARTLASDGHIDRAEAILEIAKSFPTAAESTHLADAKAKVTDAKEARKKDIERFRSYARKQDQKFSTIIRAAYAHFRSSGAVAIGRFATSDGNLVVIIGPDGADAALKLGATSYVGRLQRHPLSFEGTVSQVGVPVLTAGARNLLILQVGEESLRAILPPMNLEQREELQIFELYSAPETPALPADLQNPGN